MQQLQQIIEAAQAGGGRHHGAGFSLGNLRPNLQVQFDVEMARVQRDLGAMDGVRREQAELRMADMLGQASSAGMDVSSWRSNG